MLIKHRLFKEMERCVTETRDIFTSSLLTDKILSGLRTTMSRNNVLVTNTNGMK